MNGASWTVAVVGVAGVVVLALFLSYRADYIRARHPEPTVMAVRLTFSTIRQALRFRRGQIEHERRHSARRFDDLGTINRPMPAIPDPRTSGEDTDRSLKLSHRRPRRSVEEPPE